MPIFLRGDVYWIDIRHQGKRFRKSTGTADEEAAQRYHDQLKADLWRLDKLDEPLDRSFAEAVAKWRAENSHKKYMRDQRFKLIWLVERIGDMPLRKITTRTVEDLIERKQAERWRGRPVSNATINRHLSALSVVLKSARKWGWIKELPTIPQRSRNLTHFCSPEWTLQVRSELPGKGSRGPWNKCGGLIAAFMPRKPLDALDGRDARGSAGDGVFPSPAPASRRVRGLGRRPRVCEGNDGAG